MMNIAHLVVMMVDSTSETSLSASNSTEKGRAVLDRSEINDDGEQL